MKDPVMIKSFHNLEGLTIEKIVSDCSSYTDKLTVMFMDGSILRIRIDDSEGDSAPQMVISTCLNLWEMKGLGLITQAEMEVEAARLDWEKAEEKAKAHKLRYEMMADMVKEKA
jgi:hypothetical protein